MTDMEKNATTTITTTMTTTPRPSIQILPPHVEASSSSKEPRVSCSSVDSLKKGRSVSGSRCDGAIQEVVVSKAEDDEDPSRSAAGKPRSPGKVGRILLPVMAILILGWWVSSTVLPATRHRWIVQTLWAWFLVLVIVFRFVPISVVTRPVSAVWSVGVSKSVANIPFRGRLALLWLGALGITCGSAFGFARPAGTAISDRAISVVGVYFFQLCVYGFSHNRGAVDWIRIPISIILQQALAILVLKTDAGHSIVAWFNAAVADFCTCAVQATGLIFDPTTAGLGWFFASGLGVIIFVAAVVQILYFFNFMQWFTKQFAWLGQNVLGASGAETFVALWSPWFGQGNTPLLVGPYVDGMTDAELSAVMAVSMSSLSSLSINKYVNIPTRNLLAQSAIVIPSSIINAKIAFPEEDPSKVVTRTRDSTCAARKKLNLRKAVDLLDCVSDGAMIGLKVAGAVLTNFFALLALLLFLNGTLIWIFRGFSVPTLDLHQVIAAPLYPFVFFLGVPRSEIFSVAYVISGKLLVSADFAYAAVATGASAAPGSRGVVWSTRALSVMGVAVGNTASLPSLGIQLGVLTALSSPSRKSMICKAGIPAVFVALFTTLQGAAVAATLL